MGRCLDAFFELHHADTFCALLHRPDVEGGGVDPPLLAAAVVCLCSRYLAADEARELFALASGLDVCRQYTPAARALARASSDEPSVANIQGNLVLAVSELVSKGSSPWMYAGTVIRMAQMMRLNKEYHQSHPLREQEMRRRTFWACFFMDRLLAYFLTKPATLPGTDAALTYEEPSRGLTLASIGGFGGFPSEASYARHAGLGHGRAFAAMHLLLRSALCTAHQAYLPQLDGSSLLRRELGLVAACVDGALAAAALFSVANTLLWLRFADDAEHARQAVRADAYFALVVDFMGAWAETWRAAG